jgi:hypothetical protein
VAAALHVVVALDSGGWRRRARRDVGVRRRRHLGDGRRPLAAGDGVRGLTRRFRSAGGGWPARAAGRYRRPSRALRRRGRRWWGPPSRREAAWRGTSARVGTRGLHQAAPPRRTVRAQRSAGQEKRARPVSPQLADLADLLHRERRRSRRALSRCGFFTSKKRETGTTSSRAPELGHGARPGDDLRFPRSGGRGVMAVRLPHGRRRGSLVPVLLHGHLVATLRALALLVDEHRHVRGTGGPAGRAARQLLLAWGGCSSPTTWVTSIVMSS